MKTLSMVLICLVCCCGCRTVYQARVNGYSASGRVIEIPRTSSIAVLNNSNAPNPLLEKEVARKVARLLKDNGYNPVATDADYYLMFNYGIDSGQTITSIVPVHSPGNLMTYRIPDGAGGYRYSTIHTPGQTDYMKRTETVYNSILVLRLFKDRPSKENNDIEPLWIADVTVSANQPDLRDLINYMLIAGFDHFGQHTGKAVIKRFKIPDERAEHLVEGN